MRCFEPNRRLILLLALVPVLVGCAAAGQVTELEGQVEALRTENGALALRVEALEASVALLNLSDFSTSGWADRVSNIEGRVSAAEGLLIDLDDLGLQIQGHAEDNEFAIESIRLCVNDYMDTIGRWSSNLNTTFTYFYC
jgi:hypothetical protein